MRQCYIEYQNETNLQQIVAEQEQISLGVTQDYRVLLAELKDKNIDHRTVL